MDQQLKTQILAILAPDTPAIKKLFDLYSLEKSSVFDKDTQKVFSLLKEGIISVQEDWVASNEMEMVNGIRTFSRELLNVDLRFAKPVRDKCYLDNIRDYIVHGLGSIDNDGQELLLSFMKRIIELNKQ